jgi:cation diffusion facilitator CzcD-associated flavoprotein CzcO
LTLLIKCSKVLESIVSRHEKAGCRQHLLTLSSLSSPGARTDSESWVYILNISTELNNDWTWKERFPRQDEVLEYLNHVAARFDMHKDIQFNTRVRSAIFDNTNGLWSINTTLGEDYTCRYFICATGALSVGRDLPFPGVKNFKGESYLTYSWPHRTVGFKGKRIGIIGTGATSVQIIPTVAHSAASVTVFQRTPNYVLPARNHPLTSDQQNEIKRNYDAIWQDARTQIFGMAVKDSKLTIKDMKNATAIQRVLEYGWEIGGFRFIFETFADLTTSEEANYIASEFVRNKIRAIVKDEETAELLCPDHPIMAKRPPLGHHYFETYV